MKQYKQLSLFDEEKKPSGNVLIIEMLKLVSTFESEEEFKEVVDNRLEEILRLYSIYDPNVEIKEQLSCSGRVNLVAIKQTLKEDMMVSIDPENLRELNKLISCLCYLAQEFILNSFKSDEDSVIDLIREYCSVLSTYKKHLGV